jgi:hypothetical protein
MIDEAVLDFSAGSLTLLTTAFWGSLYGPYAEILPARAIDPFSIAITVNLMLILPLTFGVTFNVRRPDLTRKLRLPARAVKTALAVAHRLGLSQYGPEQVRFLQYRPVLDNDRLKRVFGYTPELSSAEVFDLWLREAEG